MKGVREIIQEAESDQAFVSSGYLQTYVQRGVVRVDLAGMLAAQKETLISQAATALRHKQPTPSESTQENFELQVTACVRACAIILLHITYAVVSGTDSVLDRVSFQALEATDPNLSDASTLLIRAVLLLKAAAIALASEVIKDAEVLSELAANFDQVVDRLKDEDSEPLWMRLVEMGRQVPDSEWAKLPTDLSRNFEHYMYGAPKEE